MQPLHSDLKNDFNDILGFSTDILIKQYIEFIDLVTNQCNINGTLHAYNQSNDKRAKIMTFLKLFMNGEFGTRLDTMKLFYDFSWNYIHTEAFVEGSYFYFIFLSILLRNFAIYFCVSIRFCVLHSFLCFFLCLQGWEIK